jgi:predicted GNAT family N-acyltransferase
LEERPPKPNFIIEPLGPQHDRAAFSCGVVALDQYLQNQASQDIKKHLAAVFVLTPDSKIIAGYYTLSNYSVRLDEIPEALAGKLTRMPEIPAALIGRLARSLNHKGQGIGELLLTNALKRSLETAKQMASWAVIVDSKDKKATDFYKKYGFIEIPNRENRLFLPMTTIAKLDL